MPDGGVLAVGLSTCGMAATRLVGSAGSTTEAVQPLGCLVKRSMSPVVPSTRQQPVVSTRRLLAHRKSTPKMGKFTSARRNSHSKVQLLKPLPPALDWMAIGADEAGLLIWDFPGLVRHQAEGGPCVN